MTIKTAIMILEEIKALHDCDPILIVDADVEALDMAIKALREADNDKVN